MEEEEESVGVGVGVGSAAAVAVGEPLISEDVVGSVEVCKFDFRGWMRCLMQKRMTCL